jgi:hypothetical protein
MILDGVYHKGKAPMKFIQNAKWLFALIPLSIYILTLKAGIPQNTSHFFQVYSFGLFLLVLCLHYFVLREKHTGTTLIFWGFSLILFALPLVFLWSTAYSDNKVFAGFLPYKDGKNYFLASQKILNGFPAGGSSQGTWRPLFPGLLSSLLLITDKNLQWAIAALVLMVAVAAFLSARQIQPVLGILASTYYLTLIYFYIQPWLGYTMSEVPGMIFGCLGFALLWKSAQSKKNLDLVLGLFLLFIGVSARAGAFFIFPTLVLWAGWAWRAEKRFSFTAFLISIATVIISLVLVSGVYPRLLGITESAQGNFAYTIYGQVRGGIGWLDSVKELNTSRPELVYQEAYHYFLRHPLSLLIGAAKSYRDFFFPGYIGIFGSIWHGNSLLDMGVWFINTILVAIGLFQSVKHIRTSHASLVLAGFAGILLSIPFLPPGDGGIRFYASTMPFFFIVPAFALRTNRQIEMAEFIQPLYSFGFLLIFMTVLLPPLTQRMAALPQFRALDCDSGETPFAIRVSHGSYLDFQPDSATSCGYLPDICLGDFRANGVERGVDDFFDEVVAIAESSNIPTRFLIGYNLLEDNMYYFAGSPDQLQEGPVTGCALEDRTSKQKILIVQSVVK